MNSAIETNILEDNWSSICREDELAADSGVCVLFNGEQVAIFKERFSNRVFAISNFDPIGEANVLSRGIVGSLQDRIVVASPLYKQHFCLETGECLEEEQKVKTFKVRVDDGDVQLSA